MPGIRERQLQKRKQDTLDVALRLLIENGYANLNMDELAEEVGISKPTLYQYFNSKDELVAQAMVRMFEKMEEQLTALSERSPLAQLEHYLRLMLKSHSEKHSLMAQVDHEMMRSIVQRYPYMTEHLLATRARLDRIVKQAQALGEIDPALPAWVVVNAVFSLVGIIHNPMTRADPQRSDAELSAAIESIVHLFRRGVCGELPLKTSNIH